MAELFAILGSAVLITVVLGSVILYLNIKSWKEELDPFFEALDNMPSKKWYQKFWKVINVPVLFLRKGKWFILDFSMTIGVTMVFSFGSSLVATLLLLVMSLFISKFIILPRMRKDKEIAALSS